MTRTLLKLLTLFSSYDYYRYIQYMIIGSRNNLSKINVNPTIKIGGESINRVKTTKRLGVVIDDKLKWEDHIATMVQKLGIIFQLN